MTAEIIDFKLKYRPSREQAKQWLIANVDEWPETLRFFVSEDLFHGWRFVLTTNGAIYFANSVDQGIGWLEFKAAKEEAVV